MKLLSIFVFSLLLYNNISSQESNIKVNQTSYYIHQCEDVIYKFEQELDSILTQSITNGDPNTFVALYSFDAHILSDRYETDTSISLRRVSLNPKSYYNLAESYEVDVLNVFDSLENSWQTLSILVEKNNTLHYFYFKPIRAKESCLLCHSSTNNVPYYLRKQLLNLYPEGKNSSVEVGELLGMYVVELKVPNTKNEMNDLISNK